MGQAFVYVNRTERFSSIIFRPEEQMAQSNTQKVRRFPQPADETVAIPAQDEAPAQAPATPANDTTPKAVPAKKRSRRPLIFAGIGIIALVAGGSYGYQYLTVGQYMLSTDDAYVEGDIATISSKLSGYVAKVDVVANQTVKTGDPLVTLDDGDYRIARDQAAAQIATQKLTLSRIDAQIGGAQAGVDQAKAQKVALAQGDAQRFLSVYDQFKVNPSVTERRLYLETMSDVFGHMNKVLVDPGIGGAGGGSGVVPYLPLEQLLQNAPARLQNPAPANPAPSGSANQTQVTPTPDTSTGASQ